MERVFTRRHFLATSSAMLALAGARPVLGQAKQIQVPAVDTLVVRVLVDSSFDTPKPPASKLVRVRRSSLMSSKDYRKALHNEWGLSLALESRIGGDARHLMLDYGYTPDALMNNMEVMEVDPAKMRALIMSHGHFDHFGGLVAFLDKHRARLPRELTLYAGGEDNFCNRRTASGAPGHFADWGVLDRRELERLKVKIVMCEQPTVIEGHAFTTGTIARRSFEKVLPNTRVSYRKTDGIGCDMPQADAKAQGAFVADEHLHEHATCFNVRDRGLVVISSCGHAGIVNTVRQAMEVSGVSKVHAAMGGFHLFPAPDDYVRRTVAELRELGTDVIVPLHCSGPGMVNALREMAPDRLIPSTTGTEFTFGA
jgi:7,8-dihydropterin-6-yl-methyl-4-(beta-D-ribofuranosyl)aminobenzene 5'-phosphate synthase